MYGLMDIIFHDNIQKYAFFENLSPFDYMILSISVFDHLRDMTRQILYISNVVNAAVEEWSVKM